MDLELNTRNALVTAGAGGLGSAVAKSFIAEGMNVTVCDVSRSALDNLARSIGDPSRLHTLECDLSDTAQVESTFESARSRWGSVDVLVNITGGPAPGSAIATTVDQWRAGFESIVLPPILLSTLAAVDMRDRGWGRIVTSTSSGVVSPIPNLALSNSLRMSLLGWSKSLANEVGEYGITSNIVVPGRIATARVASLDLQRAAREGRTPEEVARASVATIPTKRYGAPEEFANVVTFLASQAASYVSGSVMRVDGGLINAVY